MHSGPARRHPLLAIASGNRDRLGHVGAAKERAVDHDDVHLVQGDALAPAVLQGRGLVVGGEDALVVRAAEDREGRQVLLGVAALRGRVDEDGTLGGPHDVAGPQVAVGAGGADASGPGDHVGDQAGLAAVQTHQSFAQITVPIPVK